MEKITSRSNTLLAHMKKLASSGAYRRECGEYLCDSPKLLDEAIRWKADITAVVCTEGIELPMFMGVRTACVSSDIMTSISPMKTPQGVLFTCRMPSLNVPEILEGKRYVVLEDVQDPGNVGTVLRTADAFEADGVFLLPGCADLFSPKTVRASMGAVFRIKAWNTDINELKALLVKHQIPLYGAALRDDTLDAREVDYSKSAIAIGSEGRGLSELLLSQCDRTIRIPMTERCESLNAAIAASILLWEGFRNHQGEKL